MHQSRWAQHVRSTALVVFGLLPMLLLCLGTVRYTFNHFFSRAPYVLDSGWFSTLVYRNGINPHNHPLCSWADLYFGIHFSPLLSLFSALSYLFPVDRISWFAVFQAAIFVPFLISYGLCVRRLEDHSIRSVCAVLTAGIAFASSGLTLLLVGSLHFEAATSGLMCVVLALVTFGRRKTAWLALTLVWMTREDAGVHLALALIPFAVLSRQSLFETLPKRTIGRMIAASFAASVIAVASQRLWFHPVDMLRHVYLGDPLFSHLSADVVAERAVRFARSCQFVYFPVLTTTGIAVAKRDYRYLMGWFVTLPWFVLNALAQDEAKSVFSSYTGFPFIAGMFWVLLYAAWLAPLRARPSRIGALLLFAGVCASSTVGLYLADPRLLSFTLRDMTLPHASDRETLRNLPEILSENRAALGRLYVDQSVAALAFEAVALENGWVPGTTNADTIAFHSGSWARDEIAADLVANGISKCRLLVDTRITVCSKLDRELIGAQSVEVPASMAFGSYDKRSAILGRGGVFILNAPTELRGTFGRLSRGKYILTVLLDGDPGGIAELRWVQGAGATSTTRELKPTISYRIPLDADGEAVRFELDARLGRVSILELNLSAEH
jgi:hypothetical protein